MKKREIIIIIIIAVIIAGIAYSIYSKEEIIEEPPIIPEDNFTLKEKTCIESGGVWIIDGLLPDIPRSYSCKYRYSDGDKPCSSSEECEGDCIIRTTGEAKCKTTSGKAGCYSTIEEYEKGEPMLCRD